MRRTSVPWVLFTLLLLPCTFTQVGCGNLIKLARNTEQICTNIHLRQSNHVLEVHCGVCVTSLGVVLKCQFFQGLGKLHQTNMFHVKEIEGKKHMRWSKIVFLCPFRNNMGLYLDLFMHFYHFIFTFQSDVSQ